MGSVYKCQPVILVTLGWRWEAGCSWTWGSSWERCE